MKTLGQKIWGTLIALLLVFPAMTGMISATKTQAATETVAVNIHKKKMTTMMLFIRLLKHHKMV